MANILADHEIKKLINSVLIGAEERYINPNGIKLRLGKHVRFHTTGEEKELGKDSFLKVNPGETVIITSLEKIDFTAETVQKIYTDSMLMGIITPTTTMMREGISQVSTKIDSGFRGTLNWSLRNGSTKDIKIKYCEPIFKLTIFLLKDDEVPEKLYGERRDMDTYQDSDGIKLSDRQIPADIPENKIVSSNFDKLDPNKQLREAGYPFDHIGSELKFLHGQFEKVSNEVTNLKEQFKNSTDELSHKIEDETKSLAEKLRDIPQILLDKVEGMFTQKLGRVIGTIIGAIVLMYSGIKLLEANNINENVIILIAMILGILILAVTYFITRKTKS